MILSLCQAHEEKLLESLIDTFKKKCMREVGFNRWEWGWNGDTLMGMWYLLDPSGNFTY